MKYKHVLVDKKNRSKLSKIEIKKQIIKALLFSVNCRKSKFFLQQMLSAFGSVGSFSKIHNRCFLTGRGHSVDTFSGLSRIVFREKANLAELPGVKKKSW